MNILSQSWYLSTLIQIGLAFCHFFVLEICWNTTVHLFRLLNWKCGPNMKSYPIPPALVCPELTADVINTLSRNYWFAASPFVMVDGLRLYDWSFPSLFFSQRQSWPPHNTMDEYPVNFKITKLPFWSISTSLISMTDKDAANNDSHCHGFAWIMHPRLQELRNFSLKNSAIVGYVHSRWTRSSVLTSWRRTPFKGRELNSRSGLCPFLPVLFSPQNSRPYVNQEVCESLQWT